MDDTSFRFKKCYTSIWLITESFIWMVVFMDGGELWNQDWIRDFNGRGCLDLFKGVGIRTSAVDDSAF